MLKYPEKYDCSLLQERKNRNDNQLCPDKENYTQYPETIGDEPITHWWHQKSDRISNAMFQLSAVKLTYLAMNLICWLQHQENLK